MQDEWRRSAEVKRGVGRPKPASRTLVSSKDTVNGMEKDSISEDSNHKGWRPSTCL
jgi:hypothetical protein